MQAIVIARLLASEKPVLAADFPLSNATANGSWSGPPRYDVARASAWFEYYEAGGSGARPASGGALARKGPARKTTGSRPSGGGGGAGILRFYTDDAPGLKMCAPP